MIQFCDAKADTNYLKTLPWYGNNNYLENFLDSICYPSPTSRIVGTDRVKYRIPIKFWIYRNNTNTGGPTLAQLQSYIDNLNRFYYVENNSLIGFYMRCNVSYITTLFPGPVNMSFFDAGLTAQSNKEKGCINIHIVDGLPGSTIGVQIRARVFGMDGIFLANTTYTRPALASTIAHEVGHYLQLEQTHEGSDSWIFMREPISRTRMSGGKPLCEKTGDLLSDTPADHDLSFNTSCLYLNVNRTDLWGIVMPTHQ